MAVFVICMSSLTVPVVIDLNSEEDVPSLLSTCSIGYQDDRY